MKVLVTGVAGFIGMHVVTHLLNEGYEVVGLDNLSDYYSRDLKLARLKETGIDFKQADQNDLLRAVNGKPYRFIKMDLLQREQLLNLFSKESFDYVIHLAAQAGVRYSIENPFVYADSNLTGFLTILEGCRRNHVKHLIYASSSSVYGLNQHYPSSERESTEHPISLYAATKKANEMMAHAYSHLYKLPTTGLRFFTVYGPWGRPDMALFLFTEAILNDKPVLLFNNGNMVRDFTYIDDLVPAIVDCLQKPASPDKNWSGEQPLPDSSSAPYRIFNVASSHPVKLTEYIEAIENALHKKAIRLNVDAQPGDVLSTFGDVTSLESTMHYSPRTSITEGVSQFVSWYLEHYHLVVA